MANLATSLLDFILDLLRDPETAAEFRADPQGTLDSAGLGDVCPADIQNARLVLDELPPAGVSSVGVTSAASPVAAAAGTAGTVGTTGAAAPVLATTTQVSPASAAPESDSVIEQLRYIQQTFTYNSETTIDVHDNVWAGKDVYQIFGDDAVVAGAGSVVAGGDVEDVTVDHSVEIEDSFNIDDSFNPENSGNTVEGDGNAVGRGNSVDNTDNSVDNSVEVDDSTGVNVGDGNTSGDAVSGIGNVVGNDVDVDLDSTATTYDGSFNDETLDVDVSGSFNETDSSTNTDLDLDVELDDVVVGNGSAGGDLTQEDFGNPTTIQDNVVVADNTVSDNNLAGDDIDD
jgi:hypothetical protein